MSHTPAPWFCTPHDEQPGTFIVKRSEHHYLQTGKDDANARLIAAAPDLLEAAKAALACIAGLTPMDTNSPEGSEIYLRPIQEKADAVREQLRNAIAKAEQP